MTEVGLDAALIKIHMKRLFRMGTLAMRQAHFATVEREEGKAFTDKLRELFAAEFKQRKAAERAEAEIK